jgi:hypothetical protein
VAPAARAGDAIALRLDEMTAMQVRELTWGHPYYSASPAELADASGALLREAIQDRIMRPFRR